MEGDRCVAGGDIRFEAVANGEASSLAIPFAHPLLDLREAGGVVACDNVNDRSRADGRLDALAGVVVGEGR